MKSKMKLSIVIAGVGIAGLAVALAFRKSRHEVIVVERTPSLGTVGAGQVSGLLVLDALGLSGRACRRDDTERVRRARPSRSPPLANRL